MAVVGELSESIGLIKLIIRLGADLNATEPYRETPLLHLAQRETVYLDVNLPMFESLLEAGSRCK